MNISLTVISFVELTGLPLIGVIFMQHGKFSKICTHINMPTVE
jgi:hypothetical protein